MALHASQVGGRLRFSKDFVKQLRGRQDCLLLPVCSLLDMRIQVYVFVFVKYAYGDEHDVQI